eukprot:scaffold33925_cov104-Isochrysis_galbana.AAC.2
MRGYSWRVGPPLSHRKRTSPSPTLSPTLLHSPSVCLFPAGEHTSEQHPATVVGAHLSGLAAGVAVHRVLRKKMHGAPAGWRRGGQAASVGEQARKRRR